MKNYSVLARFGSHFEVSAHDIDAARTIAGCVLSLEGPDDDSVLSIQPIPTVSNIEEQAFDRLTGRHKHFCPDWDGMAVDETCPEFESCLCGYPGR